MPLIQSASSLSVSCQPDPELSQSGYFMQVAINTPLW
jgi:hypothetical protein